MTQEQAFTILKSGANVFITGSAGSGKTYLLNQYIDYLKQNDIEVGITASTGIAATHIGGMTIHAWSGLGIRKTLTDSDIDDLQERSYLWKRMERVKVLVIDEISMVSGSQLGLIDKLLRSFKRNGKPFGGLQVIFCGDFFQLPPVFKGDPDEENTFAYESNIWEELDLHICYLEEQHRHKDNEYFQIMNAIRSGSVPESLYKRLISRMGKKPSVNVEPAKLYTHNTNVESENDVELNKIKGEVFEYPMYSHGAPGMLQSMKSGCLAPEILRLKAGARVMFVKNNFDAGYVNGTLGVVQDCNYETILVKVSSGELITVPRASWVIEEDGKTKAELSQYPLRLAWAITVHKSQGMSLEAAEVDLTRSFLPGMGYVALGRVRSLEGLSLVGLNDMALQIDRRALEKDSHFRDLSTDLVMDHEKSGWQKFKEMGSDFVNRNSGRGVKKALKKSTIEETKELVEAGKTLKEIAKARELKIGTIIEHLEKIKKNEVGFNFRDTVAGILSDAKLKKIIGVLKKNGIQEGEFLLGPAKNVLGDTASFDDIRIARLLI